MASVSEKPPYMRVGPCTVAIDQSYKPGKGLVFREFLKEVATLFEQIEFYSPKFVAGFMRFKSSKVGVTPYPPSGANRGAVVKRNIAFSKEIFDGEIPPSVYKQAVKVEALFKSLNGGRSQTLFFRTADRARFDEGLIASRSIKSTPQIGGQGRSAFSRVSSSSSSSSSEDESPLDGVR